MKDYLREVADSPLVSAEFSEEGDGEWHGIKGMKWGVRTPRAVLRARKKASTPVASTTTPKADVVKSGHAKASAPPVAPVHKPVSNIQDHVESSSARYSRLAQEASKGNAHNMTEQDLKFFNARTEALAKVQKMNQTEPSWLANTGKKVLQQTVQNTMQSVADGMAKKYIGGPILDSINGKATGEAKTPVAKALDLPLPKKNPIGFTLPPVKPKS